MKKRVKLASVFLLTLSVAVGCSNNRNPQKESSTGNVDHPLTPEIARTALIQMMDNPGPNVSRRDLLGDALPALKTSPVEKYAEKFIQIGPCVIDLKTATFAIRVEFPNADRHKSNHWNGEFRRSKEGVWTAEVTKEAIAL